MWEIASLSPLPWRPGSPRAFRLGCASLKDRDYLGCASLKDREHLDCTSLKDRDHHSLVKVVVMMMRE